MRKTLFYLARLNRDGIKSNTRFNKELVVRPNVVERQEGVQVILLSVVIKEGAVLKETSFDEYKRGRKRSGKFVWRHFGRSHAASLAG